MTTRYYYLRNKKNLHLRKDMTMSLGIPIAVIASCIDKQAGTIKYGLAAAHPKDHFDKQMAVKIASGRLAKKPIVLEGLPNSGHEITKRIMQDILGKSDTWTSLHKLAEKWLTEAEKPRMKYGVRSEIDPCGAFPVRA